MLEERFQSSWLELVRGLLVEFLPTSVRSRASAVLPGPRECTLLHNVYCLPRRLWYTLFQEALGHPESSLCLFLAVDILSSVPF